MTTYYKVDDDRDPYTDTLPRDLSSISELRFRMEHVVSGTVVVNSTATVTNSGADSSDVTYEWSDGDLNRSGRHDAEWVITYNDGDTERFPKDDNIRIEVTEGVSSGPVTQAVATRAGPHEVYEFDGRSSAPDTPPTGIYGLWVDDSGIDPVLTILHADGTLTTVGSGGGTDLAIEDDGTQIVSAADTIDFAGSAFDVSNPSGDAVTVVLTNDSLTVAGNSVALGGSTAVDHADLSNIGSGDHHAKYTDEEAQDAVGTILGSLFTYDDATPQITLDEAEIDHDAIDQTTVSADDHHAQDQSANYTDGGSFEIDAAEFAAALGTAGQVLQSDGAAASWATLAFGDLSGSASLAQLSAILDANDDVEAAHLAAANLPDHASRHSDGGADELDVADLAGGLGTVDTVPLSDGSAVSWGTVPNTALTNSSVTVTAGDGLKNGGGVSLGGSTIVDIEPADFAGAGLADDGSDNLTPDTADEGTITASGGATPAADTVVSTSLGQTDAYDVLLYVDADPAFDADYQFNYDYAHRWDDSTSTVKIDFTVTWDTDPGAGNDVTLRWEVIRR